jgi:putative hemolysin
MSLTCAFGPYQMRLAEGGADLAAALALRDRAFRGGVRGADRDAFDAICRHAVIEDRRTGATVCTWRMFPVTETVCPERSYAARFFGLARIASAQRPLLEIGRFCIGEEVEDPQVLRLAWAALTRIVDEAGIGMIFGCASLPGLEARPYAPLFSMLARRHLAPPERAPEVLHPGAVRLVRTDGEDRRTALSVMPPLLRSYLALGAWVGDHAVPDPDLGTLVLLVGLETARVPPARAAALRRIAGPPLAAAAL